MSTFDEATSIDVEREKVENKNNSNNNNNNNNKDIDDEGLGLAVIVPIAVIGVCCLFALIAGFILMLRRRNKAHEEQSSQASVESLQESTEMDSVVVSNDDVVIAPLHAPQYPEDGGTMYGLTFDGGNSTAADTLEAPNTNYGERENIYAR